MLTKLEVQVMDSENKHPLRLPNFASNVDEEAFTRLLLGIFALDTLLTLYLGEPVAAYLRVRPVRKMSDDFEETQDWNLYVDPTKSSGPAELSPQQAYTNRTYKIRSACAKAFQGSSIHFSLTKALRQANKFKTCGG